MMSSEERDLIMSLVVVPGRGKNRSPEEFLHLTGKVDGKNYGSQLLRSAVAEKNPDDLELALIVCGAFDPNTENLPILAELISADWHFKHEDVVSQLGQLQTLDAVDALYEATQWVPAYLDFDDSRALAKKAIWALGRMSSHKATQALKRLVSDDSQIIREGARSQLERRQKGMS